MYKKVNVFLSDQIVNLRFIFDNFEINLSRGIIWIYRDRLVYLSAYYYSAYYARICMYRQRF